MNQSQIMDCLIQDIRARFREARASAERQLGLNRYATAHEIHRLIALMPIHGVGGWSILRGILAGKPPMTTG